MIVIITPGQRDNYHLKKKGQRVKVIKLFIIHDKSQDHLKMKRHLRPLLIPLISMCAVLPTFGDAEAVSCAEHSIVANAVRTLEDVQAFVQCTYDYAQEVGVEEAYRAFHEEERSARNLDYLNYVL